MFVWNQLERAGALSPGEVEALMREEAQCELQPREEEEVGEVDQAQDLQLPHSCRPRHSMLPHLYTTLTYIISTVNPHTASYPIFTCP